MWRGRDDGACIDAGSFIGDVPSLNHAFLDGEPSTGPKPHLDLASDISLDLPFDSLLLHVRAPLLSTPNKSTTDISRKAGQML
jgi:hypothetical protein